MSQGWRALIRYYLHKSLPALKCTIVYQMVSDKNNDEVTSTLEYYFFALLVL